jgi:hypothetical protein
MYVRYGISEKESSRATTRFITYHSTVSDSRTTMELFGKQHAMSFQRNEGWLAVVEEGPYDTIDLIRECVTCFVRWVAE